MFARKSSNYSGILCVFVSLLISEKTESTQTCLFRPPFLNFGLTVGKNEGECFSESLSSPPL